MKKVDLEEALRLADSGMYQSRDASDCLRHTTMVKLTVAREALDRVAHGQDWYSKEIAREALAKIGGSDG